MAHFFPSRGRFCLWVPFVGLASKAYWELGNQQASFCPPALSQRTTGLCVSVPCGPALDSRYGRQSVVQWDHAWPVPQLGRVCSL